MLRARSSSSQDSSSTAWWPRDLLTKATTPTATPHTHTQSPAPSCTATSARRFRTACPTAPTSTPSGVCVAAACAVLCVLLRAAACCVLRAACCVLQRTAPRGATTMHTTTNPGRHPCPHTHTPKKHHSAYIETLPGQESPALFGLHANADLTFRSLRWLGRRLCIETLNSRQRIVQQRVGHGRSGQ